ncbi:MAG: hypothetical protein AAGJ46_19185 [Planctomycetota bacterium]
MRCHWLVALAAGALLAPAAAGGELAPFASDAPRVRFDVPRHVSAVLVEGPEDAALRPGERLFRVELPVSVVVQRGDADRVEQVSIEVNGAAAGLTVFDYAPRTTLQSEYAGTIEVESTGEKGRHLDASLGGVLPNPSGGVAQLAPSISGGKTEHDSRREKATKLAPLEPVVVAGAVQRRRGVLFQFRPSSQTTLEGERLLEITFVAPADGSPASAPRLNVACAAVGEGRVLLVKQRRTWGAQSASVALRLPRPHVTAKPIVRGPIAVKTAGQPATLWKARSMVGSLDRE